MCNEKFTHDHDKDTETRSLFPGFRCRIETSSASSHYQFYFISQKHLTNDPQNINNLVEKPFRYICEIKQWR